MRRKHIMRLVLGLVPAILLVGPVFADGGGNIRLGYVITDEEGHLGVNQETFNLYDGPVVSINDFQYQTTSGFNFAADLNRMALNNRNLRASASKAGLFGLTLSNNQYRRTYDFEGNRFTRRRNTAAQAHFYPMRKIKLFGGYGRTDKHGENFHVFQPVNDTVITATDYTQTRFNLGAQASFDQGHLRTEYRRLDFTDDASGGDDRQSDVFSLLAFAPLSRYKQVVLSGGYNYRRDRHESSAVELTTNQGWGAFRARLPHNFSTEYRFLFARTEQNTTEVETDNVVNTFSISRNWTARGGLRIGYENRISDDLIDRTVANSILFSGWYRINNAWLFRGRFSTRARDVKTGTTLVGDENFTRHQLSVKYRQESWGDLTLRYQGRIKTNVDINTRIEYNAVTAALNLVQPKYGRMNLTYTYYLGQFENRSTASPEEFEFSDHVLSGTIHPATHGNLETSFGATYYRSRRDRDTEKFSLDFGARYEFPMDHILELRYRVCNFDDFQVSDRYYTGNIIDLSIIKGFTL
ncbi:MAG: hypothetical protein GY841_20895 [FCB group bacterium]|nr:hypothetical protein [FCB group bacterium]